MLTSTLLCLVVVFLSIRLPEPHPEVEKDQDIGGASWLCKSSIVQTCKAGVWQARHWLVITLPSCVGQYYSMELVRVSACLRFG